MKPLDISGIDKNMRVISKVTEEDVVFYDVRETPFDVYGLYDYKTGHEFMRMPVAVATATSLGVHDLNYCTAGGRVRFSTDSRYVAIHANMRYLCHMDHMAMTGSTGFDLYVDDPDSNISRYQGTFRPGGNTEVDAYESVLYFPTKTLRHFTINFPLYSGVNDLFVGVQKDATLGGGAHYRDVPPIRVLRQLDYAGRLCLTSRKRLSSDSLQETQHQPHKPRFFRLCLRRGLNLRLYGLASDVRLRLGLRLQCTVR